jgi:hypothetical protein
MRFGFETAFRSSGENFVVSEDNLCAIVEVVRSTFGQNPRISISLRSERTLHSEDVLQLLKENLIRTSPIKNISLSSYGGEKGNCIFELSDSGPPVSYRASGTKELCLIFEHEIENILSSMRPWYSGWNINTYQVTWRSFGLFIAFFAIIGSALAGFGAFDNLGFPATWAIMAIFPIAFNTLSAIAFPPIVFSFGVGARQQKRRSSAAIFLMTVIIAGLIVTIIGNFLTDGLKSILSDISGH